MGGPGILHGAFEGTKGSRRYKEKISVWRAGGKAKDNIPSWAKGEKPYVGESGKIFAKRLLDRKYGTNNYKKGANSEYSKMQKYADTHFK
jgi:hypothetical protein